MWLPHRASTAYTAGCGNLREPRTENSRGSTASRPSTRGTRRGWCNASRCGERRCRTFTTASQLQAKVAQLEAALARNSQRPPVAAAPAARAMPGITAPAGGTMNMMAKMDKMMSMMDKMMSMRGGATPAGAPMASGAGGQGMGMMEDDMGEMGSMQPGQGAPAAAGMSGMGGGVSPPGVDAGMVARLDKMTGMMDMMVRMMDKTVGMMDRMTGGMGGGSMQPGQGMPAAGGTGMMDDDMGEMSPMQPGQAAPPMGGDM